MTFAPRTRWTAALMTRKGQTVEVTVYAAGRVRAGQLADFIATRRFGAIAAGLALVEA